MKLDDSNVDIIIDPVVAYPIWRLNLEQENRYSKAIHQLEVQAQKWLTKVGYSQLKTKLQTKVILTNVGRYQGTITCPMKKCGKDVMVPYTKKNLWTSSNFLRHFSVSHSSAKKVKTNKKTSFGTNDDANNGSSQTDVTEMEEKLKTVVLKWFASTGVNKKQAKVKVKVAIASNGRYHGKIKCPIEACGKNIAFVMSKSGAWNGSNYRRHFKLCHSKKMKQLPISDEESEEEDKQIEKNNHKKFIIDEHQQQVKMQESLSRGAKQWLVAVEQEKYQDRLKVEVEKSGKNFVGKIQCPLPNCEREITLTLYGKVWNNSNFKHHFDTFHETRRRSSRFSPYKF